MSGSHARRNRPSTSQKPCNPSNFLNIHCIIPKDWGIRRSLYHWINLSCITHIISFIHIIQHITNLSNKEKSSPKLSWQYSTAHSVGKPLAKSNSHWQSPYLSNSKDQSSNNRQRLSPFFDTRRCWYLFPNRRVIDNHHLLSFRCHYL